MKSRRSRPDNKSVFHLPTFSRCRFRRTQTGFLLSAFLSGTSRACNLHPNPKRRWSEEKKGSYQLQVFYIHSLLRCSLRNSKIAFLIPYKPSPLQLLGHYIWSRFYYSKHKIIQISYLLKVTIYIGKERLTIVCNLQLTIRLHYEFKLFCLLIKFNFCLIKSIRFHSDI